MDINKKSLLVIVSVAIVVLIIAGFSFYFRGISAKYWFRDANNFAECVEATGKILTSYPEQCIFRQKSFTNPEQILENVPEMNQSYDISDYGISYGVPINWQSAKYTSRTSYDLSGKSVVALALDPKSVSTQEEYQTLDKPPGMIVMALTDISPSNLIGYANKISPEKLSSELVGYKNRQTFGAETDNPWWQEKIRTDYYINIPLANQKNHYITLVISIANTIAEDKNTNLQTTIKSFIDSISFNRGANNFQDPTLKTYNNTSYGFSFQHPTDGLLQSRNIQDNGKDLYARIQNYDPDVDRITLKPGEYYIELSAHHATDPTGYIAPQCAEGDDIPNPLKMNIAGSLTTIYYGSGKRLGDAGGKVFAICAQNKTEYYTIRITENDSASPIGNTILKSLKFSK